MSSRDTLAELVRPRLLVRAARLAALDYRAARDLRSALGTVPSRRQVLPTLLAAEEEAEGERRTGARTYSASHHISLLAALIAEARAQERRPVAA
ncbi:MAG: DUF6477 family protein [Pseudomonadota bacterium]